MSTKTNTTSAPDAGHGASPAAAAPSLQEDCNIVVIVLRNKTQVGDIICAKGARVRVTQTQADTLVKMGMAKLGGVQ